MFNRNPKPPQEQPLFETHYTSFWIKVYATRIEFKSSLLGGAQTIPLNQIASISLGMAGMLSITLETTGGKRYMIPTTKKQEVQQAIYDAQARLTSQSQGSPPFSVADELTKLDDLRRRGVITEAQFEEQRRRLLGS